MARPPDTITLAEVSSGRSDLASASPPKRDSDVSVPARSSAATGASARPSGVTAKAAVRTVTTFTGSADRTVWMALPA